jgi:hypothetical protein
MGTVKEGGAKVLCRHHTGMKHGMKYGMRQGRG